MSAATVELVDQDGGRRRRAPRVLRGSPLSTVLSRWSRRHHRKRWAGLCSRCPRCTRLTALAAVRCVRSAGRAGSVDAEAAGRACHVRPCWCCASPLHISEKRGRPAGDRVCSDAECVVGGDLRTRHGRRGRCVADGGASAGAHFGYARRRRPAPCPEAALVTRRPPQPQRTLMVTEIACRWAPDSSPAVPATPGT